MSNLFTLDPSTIGYYPLESNGNDQSSSVINLTQNGTMTYQTVDGMPFGQKCPGSFSDTNYFSGPTKLLTKFSNLMRITFSFYFYAKDLSNNPCLISWNNGSLNFIQVMSTGAVKFSYNDGSGIFILTATGAIITNRWYHMAITMDGVNNYLYIDRVFKGKVANAAGSTGTVNAIGIGRLVPNTTFALSGHIKGVKINNAPLTVFPLN